MQTSAVLLTSIERKTSSCVGVWRRCSPSNLFIDEKHKKFFCRSSFLLPSSQNDLVSVAVAPWTVLCRVNVVPCRCKQPRRDKLQADSVQQKVFYSFLGIFSDLDIAAWVVDAASLLQGGVIERRNQKGLVWVSVVELDSLRAKWKLVERRAQNIQFISPFEVPSLHLAIPAFSCVVTSR